jgi:predicted MFS family arabinose efflux permease
MGDPSVTPSPSPSPRLAVAAFVAMGSIYFFSYFQRVAVPGTIFNELQADLGLSAVAVAALGSMFTWIYGGTQIVAGLLADRYGGARTLLGGGLGMLAGAALFPLAHTAWPLFAARALTGFGASFMYLSIVRELDRLFGHRHFTVWLGVTLAIGYAGGLTGTLPFERAAAAFGWRNALLAVAGLLGVALALAGLVLRRLGPEAPARRPLSLAPLREVLRQRRNWPLMGSSFILFAVFFVMQTVLGKKFLEDFGGLSSPTAAGFILIMAATSMAVVMLGGYLPRRLGERRRPWLVTGALVLCAATGLLLVATLARAPGWVFLGGYILLAASGISQPSGTAVIKELNRPEAVGAAVSVFNALAYIGCGTIGQAGGWILSRYRDAATVTVAGVVYPPAAYVALCTFLAALAALNLLFILRVPEPRAAAHLPADPLP